MIQFCLIQGGSCRVLCDNVFEYEKGEGMLLLNF